MVAERWVAEHSDAERSSTQRAIAESSVERRSTVAWPLTFRAEDASVAGFFHPPSESVSRDLAVVLCNPIGWEAVAAHRAHRHLAEELAQAGFPVLRFDYPGTGDSSGQDSDPDRVRAWLSGLSAAIRKVKALSDRPKVALVGFHLGGTLAVLAAQAAGGIDTLVLWSPYTKGRVFVREANAYRALNAPDPKFPKAEDQGGLESAGFLFSASTLAELSALDLLADKSKPAEHVLLLERGEKPTGQALVNHFESSGAQVERIAAPGYLDMMQEPRKSVVPNATFAIIVSYLSQKHPPSDEIMPPPRSIPPLARRLEIEVDGRTIIEDPMTFGPNGHFFGILSGPAAPTEADLQRPVILFLTTASHHRIGPNRMYVPMARTLARLGFRSLRFDLTGVGDTPTVPGVIEGHSYAASFVNDVRIAMDHLQSVSTIKNFVTVGLCSGAYLGFHTALHDARVAGAVLINSQTFNWREGDSLEINRRVTFMSNRFYQRAALDPRVWRRALNGQVNLRGIGTAVFTRWKKRVEVEAHRVMRRLGVGDEERVDVGDAFSTLVKRGVDVLMVYSGNDEGLDYLASEGGSRLRRLKRKRNSFRLEVIDGPDHTFTQLWAQKRLTDLVLSHIASQFAK